MFSTRSVTICYKHDKSILSVDAGSNTSTVTLLVVGGDEKEVSNLRQ
jgi:hypothetical protein